MQNLQNLPPLQTGPIVWRGPEMAARESEWVMPLSPAEIQELEAAAEPLVTSNIGAMKQSDFPLPRLGPRLAALREELIHGRGFALLRGLPVAGYSEREAATIFYGLGTHLGYARSQNAQGHVLGHVLNLGVDSSDPNVRIYQNRFL